MKNFSAHSEKQRLEMLRTLGLNNIEDLFSQVPKALRVEDFELGGSLSQMRLEEYIKTLASKNKTDYVSFLGGGAYKKFLPYAVETVVSRFEFNTAYTPYQSEISQGTLQAIFEYQSMICSLTNMDVSNASLYDGGAACAQAVLMAVRITGRKKCLVSKAINPSYLEVLQTYCEAADVTLDLAELDGIKTGETRADNSYACVLIQTPNYFGEIEEIQTIKRSDENTLLICCCDLTALSLLEPPECDVMVGEIQGLGNTLSYGGPYCGYFACKDKFKRQIPGRIAGMTQDASGKTAYTLTLQTREQHIRREKATDNICSNQALCALRALVYLTVMGKSGLSEAACLSAKNAHKLCSMLKSKGIEVLNKNFFNEFVYRVSDAKKVLNTLKENNILGGTAIDTDKILVCTTELITDSQIEKYLLNVSE